jgi:hypothetical protein
MATADEHAREIAELRDRVDALERAVGLAISPDTPERTAAVPTRAATAPATSTDDVFWALNALKSWAPPPGAVLYTGSVTLPAGGVADWQYALTTDDLLARDWSRPASVSALAALGHPVRLRLLQAIITGTVAVSELAALEGVGTTGQVYHHVNQLIAAGWVYSPSRGHYGIPPERVVPLLTVILAGGLS